MPIPSHRPMLRLFTAVPAIAAVWACASILSLTGCGKQRETPPEERGEPNVLPPEFQLFREARETIIQWLERFGEDRESENLYALLSDRARADLRSIGIPNGPEFKRWFHEQAARGEAPFYYRFSRIDVLDVDMPDTARATLTVGFIVNVGGDNLESVGTFFLVRERGKWKVPFGQGKQWVRSWWEQDRSFTRRVIDRDFNPFVSRTLDIELQYPVTWDAHDGVTFRVPVGTGERKGCEFVYKDPVSEQRELIVRIWDEAALPSSPSESPDSTDLTLVREENATLTDSQVFHGVHHVFRDRRGDRYIHFFGGVNESLSHFDSYRSVISSVLRSLSTIP
ncbi:MAG: hypothetical protein QHI48_07740 [Bacteroidota bacterium]|nr:hypothetical protein [Bacteroidota bacterium]